MGRYGDGPPRRLVLLAAGVAACLVVSDFAVVGVLSAFAADVTGGAVGVLLDSGTGLVDEAVQFLIGCVIAAAVLAVILAVTGGFDGGKSVREDETAAEREDPDENGD